MKLAPPPTRHGAEKEGKRGGATMLEIRGIPCAVEKDGSRGWGWMAGAGHLAWIQIQNGEKRKKG